MVIISDFESEDTGSIPVFPTNNKFKIKENI
jgi:hypothetical protein